MSDTYRPSREDGESILRMIVELRGAYAPRRTAWSDLDAEQARRLTAQWLIALQAFPPEHVAEAIDLHREGQSGAFFPSLADIEDLARQVQRASAATNRHEAIAAMSSPCDGSGFVTRFDDDGRSVDAVPCGRCNPVLREVFNDRTKWRKYLTGVGLDKLNVGVTMVHGRLTSDRPMPDACRSTDDWDDNQAPLTFVPPTEGRQMAEAARRADAARAEDF